jgi:Ran GTPase-activating protein (RanGAP) involved in mRNA processing and transport
LNLDFCKGLDLGSVRKILNRCVNLNELNFRNTRLSDETEKYLAENLPSWVEKLDLSSLNFNDQIIRLVHANCPR